MNKGPDDQTLLNGPLSSETDELHSEQSHGALCDPIDGSPPGSPIPVSATYYQWPSSWASVSENWSPHLAREKTPTGAAARGNP